MNLTRRTLLARLLAAGPALGLGWSGADEIDVDIDRRIIAAAGRAKLKLLFAGSTDEEARRWQAQFRKVLEQLLGDSRPPKTWSIDTESRDELADHVRYQLVLNADGVDPLPLYLLVPTAKAAPGRRPAVLCVHGHGAFGHHPVAGRRDLPGVAENIASLHYDYGLQFVRRGYVVAAPCMIPFGRRVDRERYGKTDPCAITFVRMLALGQLSITANLRDLRWAISLLATRPEVNPSAIGCAGLSYGGRMTMLVSAIDRRIKVAAVSGALNLLQERITHRYSCGSQIIPRLLEYGDYPEIGSLIAPRPCVWEVGDQDGLIVPGWDQKFRDRLGRVYRALGVAGNLTFDDFSGGHRWNGRVAYPLFDSVLKA